MQQHSDSGTVIGNIHFRNFWGCSLSCFILFAGKTGCSMHLECNIFQDVDWHLPSCGYARTAFNDTNIRSNLVALCNGLSKMLITYSEDIGIDEWHGLFFFSSVSLFEMLEFFPIECST